MGLLTQCSANRCLYIRLRVFHVRSGHRETLMVLHTLQAIKVNTCTNGQWQKKPPKFPTNRPNRPPNLHSKRLFSPLLGQNFRKFVIFREGGWGVSLGSAQSWFPKLTKLWSHEPVLPQQPPFTCKTLQTNLHQVESNKN